MRRLLLTLRFDGTRYHGWQVQKNGRTVQETLQDAIERLTGTRSGVIGCSRTDAGVHAEQFCCTFDTDSALPDERMPDALSAHLPYDIAVLACREVPSAFHPRYSALGKEYLYRILNTRQRDPFWHSRALHIRTPLDEQTMDEAAQHLVGAHDFSAFCAAGGSVEDKRRTVWEARVEREGDLVLFRVTADGFLYNMVRIFTGTLLDIALGRMTAENIDLALDRGERALAGPTAPAAGLYLHRVFYQKEECWWLTDEAVGK